LTDVYSNDHEMICGSFHAAYQMAESTIMLTESAIPKRIRAELSAGCVSGAAMDVTARKPWNWPGRIASTLFAEVC